MVVNFTELLGREYAGKMGGDADKFISYSVEGALRIEALLKALLAYWEVSEREHGQLRRDRLRRRSGEGADSTSRRRSRRAAPS